MVFTNTGVLFSSENEVYETPQDFYDNLDREFHFELDPCANERNHKCSKYFTKYDNGLEKPWGGLTTFCNPPYGRKATGQWVKKAYDESRLTNSTIVLLVPARTDAKWFHDYVIGKSEIRFVKGRLKFGGSKNPAPFPSMVVIYRPKENISK